MTQHIVNISGGKDSTACYLLALGRGLPFRAVADRLRGVVIEQRPAVDVMVANDGPSVLHYVDPPYVMGTRGDAGADYAHEMSDADHAALLVALGALRGRVILSRYAHPLYDDALSGWRRHERRAMADGARERVEVLWCNFSRQGGLL